MPFLFEQTKQIKIADTSSSLQTEVTETFPDAASSHLPNAFSQMENLSVNLLQTFQPAVITLMHLMTQMIHLIP